MIPKEAIEAALTKLKNNYRPISEAGKSVDERKLVTEIITAAFAAMSEPVAWMHPTAGWCDVSKDVIAMHCHKGAGGPKPLYAAPQPADVTPSPDLGSDIEAMPAQAWWADRLRAILRELWAACDIDLTMCDGTVKTGQFGTLRDLREDLGHLLSVATAPAQDLASENERLRAALTPSAETRTAYIGKFSFLRTSADEHGNERYERITVPWTTVKDIMKDIREHAALEERT